MLQIPVAKVAVLAATFAFDRPYTYKIPQPLADTLRPGCRVMVPFSRGNRPCEGMVLALDKAEDDPKLKPITRQLDPEPILSLELIRLAVWMHDRFFCTIYDALHAILPAGVWYRVSTVYCAAPELDEAAALAQCGRSKQRRLALETVLEHGGRCPLDELQAAFGDKEPASALHWLVEQKFLTVEGTQKRVVRDKQLEYASLAVPLEEAQEEIRRRLMDEPLTPFTPRTITSPQALLEEYAAIRKQGYAISDGELNIETIGIGAPVRDESGNVWAAISIGAPRMRVDDAKLDRYIFLVTEIAAEMSRDLTRGTVGDSLK